MKIRTVAFSAFLLINACLYSQENSFWEDQATVSIYAVRASTGDILLDQNSSRSLNPASSMKVITTAAALHLLGPEVRFQTDLEYEGTIDENGVLHGNIIIRGGGDPCLGSNRISPTLDWKEQIEVWALAIQKLGIRKVEGEVIADSSRWEKALAVPSWSWEDLGNYYGAGASALSFHENTYRLYFSPGKELGARAKLLRTEPPLSSVQFHNEVKTGPEGSGDQACIYGSEFSFVQYIRGTIPQDAVEFSIKGAIPDPALFCGELLKNALQGKGVIIQNQKISAPSKRVVIHTTLSPSIKEIVYWTNQLSINLYAEHLLKKMGETVFQEGSSQSGTKAVLQFLQSQKIDLSGFHMVDGSGLSRKNLVTAKQMVSLLLKMKKSELYPHFLHSLPEKSELCRAKTGTMSQVRACVGYVGDVAFAILINHGLDAKKMNEKIDQVISELTEKEKKGRETLSP